MNDLIVKSTSSVNDLEKKSNVEKVIFSKDQNKWQAIKI